MSDNKTVSAAEFRQNPAETIRAAEESCQPITIIDEHGRIAGVVSVFGDDESRPTT